MTEPTTMSREKAAALNEGFFEKVGAEGGRAEIQSTVLSFIKQRLREESFARQILIPTPVTRHDLQRSVSHDTMEYIADIEYDQDPDALAMPLNFTSEGQAIYVRGKRFAIAFHKIETPMYEKSEHELMAYSHPVIKTIEDNSVKDIQWVEDSTFIGHCNGIFDDSGGTYTDIDATAGSADAHSPGTGTFSGNFDRKAVLAGFAALNGEAPTGTLAPRKLRAELVLVSEQKYLNWLDQRADSIGTGVADKITVGGYEYNTILGRKLVITTKLDLLPGDRFFVFAAQRYFGYFLVLNTTKFYVDKIADLIRWKTWEVIGMGFGNVRAVMRVMIGA